jgi:hypothetical protein
MFMLRFVKLEFKNGEIETHCVHAENNLEAFKLARADRPDIEFMIAWPLPN